MRQAKRILLAVLVLLLLSIPSASADSTSMVEKLFPGEGSMNYPADSLNFKQHPSENYVWDTSLEWFHMDGIKPVIGNPNALMDNSVATSVMKAATLLTRLGIFVLEFAYSTDFVPDTMQQLQPYISSLSDFFYNRLSGTFFLVLGFYIVFAYARGRSGLAVQHLFLSLLLVATIGIGVNNMDYLVESGEGLSNYVGTTVLGTIQLSPFEGDATDVAKQRIISTGNFLWDLNVTFPWKDGEFGTLDTVNVTREEKNELLEKYNVDIGNGQSWADVILSYSPGSDERKAIVKVLSDVNIQHDGNFSPANFAENGITDRLLLSFCALGVSLVAFIFFLILCAFLLMAKFALVVGAVFSPIFVPVPLLVRIGQGILQKFLGVMLIAMALIIAASLYLGVVLMAMYVVTLIPFFQSSLVVKQFVYILILLVGILFSPKIITKIMPAVARKVTAHFQQRQAGGGNGHGGSSIRKPAAERAEDVTERGKRFGQRQMESSEDVTERKRRKGKEESPLVPMRAEIELDRIRQRSSSSSSDKRTRKVTTSETKDTIRSRMDQHRQEKMRETGSAESRSPKDLG
jgi:hypothetical protein